MHAAEVVPSGDDVFADAPRGGTGSAGEDENQRTARFGAGLKIDVPVTAGAAGNFDAALEADFAFLKKVGDFVGDGFDGAGAGGEPDIGDADHGLPESDDAFGDAVDVGTAHDELALEELDALREADVLDELLLFGGAAQGERLGAQPAGGFAEVGEREAGGAFFDEDVDDSAVGVPERGAYAQVFAMGGGDEEFAEAALEGGLLCSDHVKTPARAHVN